MILPYVVIYTPLYFALYLMYGRLAAERAMPWKLKKTDFWKLPYVFIYAPLYFAIYIMYGKQAAEHDMPWHLKNVESSWNPRVLPDEDDEDEWEGRVLDIEERTKRLLDESIAEIKENQALMNKNVLERITKSEQKMDHIIHLLSASTTAQQQRRATTCRPAVYTQEVVDARARGDRQRADELLRRLEEWYEARVRRAEAKAPPDTAKVARLRRELAEVAEMREPQSEAESGAEGHS